MMDNSATVNFRNPAVVRKAGMSALNRELGTVGAAYFLRQFRAGQGDYTAEREKTLGGITLDEMIKNVREIDRQNRNGHI